MNVKIIFELIHYYKYLSRYRDIGDGINKSSENIEY